MDKIKLPPAERYIFKVYPIPKKKVNVKTLSNSTIIQPL